MKKTLLRFFSGLTPWVRLVAAKPVATSTPFRTTDSPDLEIDSALVRAFARGSEPAFRCIYDRYAPAIYRVACRYLGSKVLAEDLLLNVFSAFWLKREKFAEAEEVKLYLLTSARVEAMKLLKRVIEGAREATDD